MKNFRNQNHGLRALAMTLAFLLTMPAHAGDVVTYVHADHLGSPVAETNSLGQVTRNQVYSPYGETHLSADGDTAGFTGHRNDADTGLVYMQARYYDPISGRFLSTDPVTFSANKPEHFNRYWYANGNPLVVIDPNGKDTFTVYGSGSVQAFGYGGEVSIELGLTIGNGDSLDFGIAGSYSTSKETPYMPDQVGSDIGLSGGVAQYDVTLEQLDEISTETIEIDAAVATAESVFNAETGKKMGSRALVSGGLQVSAGVETESTVSVSIRGFVEEVLWATDVLTGNEERMRPEDLGN